MTPAERLHDAVVEYLGAMDDGTFRATVAAARGPVDPPADSRPGYVDGGRTHGEPAPRTLHRPQTPADALEAVRQRHGRILGEEVAR